MANRSKKLDEQALREVEMLAGLGLRLDDIAAVKGMSDDTLKKHAADHLKKGRANAKAQVMQTAFKMAISGKCPAMTIFWLKTRAGWSEKEPMVEETEGRPDFWLQALGIRAKRDWADYEMPGTDNNTNMIPLSTPDKRPINL